MNSNNKSTQTALIGAGLTLTILSGATLVNKYLKSRWDAKEAIEKVHEESFYLAEQQFQAQFASEVASDARRLAEHERLAEREQTIDVRFNGCNDFTVEGRSENSYGIDHIMYSTTTIPCDEISCATGFELAVTFDSGKLEKTITRDSRVSVYDVFENGNIGGEWLGRINRVGALSDMAILLYEDGAETVICNDFSPKYLACSTELGMNAYLRANSAEKLLPISDTIVKNNGECRYKNQHESLEGVPRASKF